MMKKKAALHNLGCKVNGYETEAMQELLEQQGYDIVPFHDKADVYVINTCTVTNIADRKSRQMLHRARKQNPDALIIAAGCYVQAQEEAGNEIEGIDILIGNNKKKDLIPILQEYEEKHGLSANGAVEREVIDINETNEFESLHLYRTAERTRAYIKVQDGCNQFCTYCIIPYVRGRIRSRSKAEVVEEVTGLAQNGYQEVVLTGIHVSSYGKDLEEDETLLTLIQAVHEVEGILRIRLSSLEPRVITEEFAEALSKLPKICPHFHLSMQSGCTETLRRMNRHYTAEEYYEKCCILRKYFENPAITTDVIVGFPGETEEEFEASKSFIDKVNFYETHVFKYSKRSGTKAAEMENQVPDEIKAKRSAQLIALNEEKRTQYEERFIGKEVEVLFEKQIEKDGKVYQMGHTKEYIRVALETEEHLENTIASVFIKNHSQILH